jgi:hypothetical protein
MVVPRSDRTTSAERDESSDKNTPFATGWLPALCGMLLYRLFINVGTLLDDRAERGIWSIRRRSG